MMDSASVSRSRDELTEIEGQVEHIVYQNEENGYTVFELSVSDTDYITAVGILPFLRVGELVKLLGKWSLHQSYGKQFSVEAYEKALPATEAAILKYLSSKAVKGVGPKTAVKIVGKYGTETFDVIEHNPEWLTDIPGITFEKAMKISESFKENFGIRSVMVFCKDFFGPSTAVKIYKRWGGAAVDVIKQNPYALCEEIYGIGFESADRIARSIGLGNDCEERIKSGIKYFLQYNANQNGHVFIPEDKLCLAASKMLGVGEDRIVSAKDDLESDGQLVIVTYGRRRCVYLKKYYEADFYTAQKLDMLQKMCDKISVEDADRFINGLEAELDMSYARLQRKAIINSLSNGVMVLTGGPGTGKTTVVRAILTLFRRMGLKIALAAPTGRAAKRLSEATSYEARTIHRLLEMEYDKGSEPRFRRCETDLLEEDVIIIDEASMVDSLLMKALLKAIKPGARLILVGDADQLPSVGAGYVLSDIIKSGCFNTVELNEIFRQASESLIVTNAHSINCGEYPELTVKNKDFFFLPRERDTDVAKTIVDLCVNRLPKKYGRSIINDIQVITPSHKGAAGTDCLNSMLQKALNPQITGKKEKKVRDVVFRVGDKVMQVKNNYDIEWEKDGNAGVGIFNGDIGRIEQINPEDENMVINFDDRIVVYDFELLSELEHSYAITIHKSQGSEYPIVIMPVYNYSPMLLTRNLLYTAITRAQQMVILVGDARIVYGMVDNNRQVNRYTGLKYILRENARADAAENEALHEKPAGEDGNTAEKKTEDSYDGKTDVRSEIKDKPEESITAENKPDFQTEAGAANKADAESDIGAGKNEDD